jgi:Tol biopolymer transport system component
MQKSFTDLLRQIIEIYGLNVFDNVESCKNILFEYANGEFQREIRLLIQTVEINYPMRIKQSKKIDLLLSELILDLQNNYSISKKAAEEIVYLLAELLVGNKSQNSQMVLAQPNKKLSNDVPAKSNIKKLKTSLAMVSLFFITLSIGLIVFKIILAQKAETSNGIKAETPNGIKFVKLDTIESYGGIMSISPDFRFVAFVSTPTLDYSSIKDVKIWDIENREELRTLSGHIAGVNSLSYSPDGKHLVSGSADHTVKIWDIESGKELRSLSGTSPIRFVHYTPDGKYIILRESVYTHRWDVLNGGKLKSLYIYHNRLFKISPNGKYMISTGSENELIISNIDTFRILHTFAFAHLGHITTVAFSPDNKYIVSGSEDHTIKVWDIENGKELQTLSGHTASINSVSYSPDGKYIVSGSKDHIKVWDAMKGEELQALAGGAGTVSYSPNGKYIFSKRENSITFWINEDF